LLPVEMNRDAEGFLPRINSREGDCTIVEKNTGPYFTVWQNDAAMPHRLTYRSLSALITTDTELKLMAAAAIMGLKRMPKNG
jgi:hypothetical protein